MPALNFFLAAASSPPPTGLELTPLLLTGAVLLVLGLLCDAVLIARFLPRRQFRVTAKPWGFRELGYAVIIFAGIFLLANALYAGLAAARRQDPAELAPLIIPIEFVLRLGMLSAFLVYFHRQRISLRQVFDLDTVRPRVAFSWGVVFALAALPPIGVVIALVNVVCRLFHIPVSPQPIVEFFLTTDSTPMLGLLVVFAVIVAPVLEELFFRGFAYPVLKQRYGITGALLLVSAIFALNHLHATSLLPLFALALGLGLAYELTGSLLTPVVMHALFNGIMLLQVFYQRAQP